MEIEVANKLHLMQYHSFEEMTRPFMDIDGFRITNKYAIFLEGKHIKNASLNAGQMNLLKMLCDMLPVPAMLVVYVHNESSPTPVDVAGCPVTIVYFKGEEHKLRGTVDEISNRFIQKYG